MMHAPLPLEAIQRAPRGLKIYADMFESDIKTPEMRQFKVTNGLY